VININIGKDAMNKLMNYLKSIGENHQVSNIIQGATKVLLTREQLMSLSIKELNNLFKSAPSIDTLDLSGSDLSDDEIVTVTKLLGFNRTIHNLILDGCNIGVAGSKKIAELLKDDSNLYTLYLRENKLGDMGAAFLADVLGNNNSLKILALSSNLIGNAGAELILKALKDNQSLEYLFLDNNKINNEIEPVFKQILEHNKYINEINLTCSEELSESLNLNKQRVKDIHLIIKKAINFYITGKTPLSFEEAYIFLNTDKIFIQSELHHHSKWLIYKGKYGNKIAIKPGELIKKIAAHNIKYYQYYDVSLENLDIETYAKTSKQLKGEVHDNTISTKFMSFLNKMLFNPISTPSHDDENASLMGEVSED
jgi:hypothetical protein